MGRKLKDFWEIWKRSMREEAREGAGAGGGIWQTKHHWVVGEGSVEEVGE